MSVGVDILASCYSSKRRLSITSRKFEAKFVGSFFDLKQLPKDRRPQIAIAGRSNVGKSSLLNHILGQRKLAKVSSTPGKTRSLNFFLINDRFYFVDLPGYGYAKVSKQIRQDWGRLIEDFLNKSPNLIGMVLLLDCRREPTGEDFTLLEWLAAREIPVMMVVTKTDKLSRSKINEKVRQVETELELPAIPYSVKTGLGKQELIGSILDLVTDH